MFAAFIIVLVTLALVFASDNVILTPIKEGKEISLILIQGGDNLFQVFALNSMNLLSRVKGAGIPVEAYVPLAKEIQAQSPYKLW